MDRVVSDQPGATWALSTPPTAVLDLLRSPPVGRTVWIADRHRDRCPLCTSTTTTGQRSRLVRNLQTETLSQQPFKPKMARSGTTQGPPATNRSSDAWTVTVTSPEATPATATMSNTSTAHPAPTSAAAASFADQMM